MEFIVYKSEGPRGPDLVSDESPLPSCRLLTFLASPRGRKRDWRTPVGSCAYVLIPLMRAPSCQFGYYSPTNTSTLERLLLLHC